MSEDLPAVCESGDSIVLSAVPSSGDDWTFMRWVFTDWPAPQPDPYSSVITEQITENLSAAAVFGCHLDRSVVGEGVIAVSEPGPYEPGTVVTLTACAKAGWKFFAWEGDYSVPDPETPEVAQVTINAPASIRALFAIDFPDANLEGAVRDELELLASEPVLDTDYSEILFTPVFSDTFYDGNFTSNPAWTAVAAYWTADSHDMRNTVLDPVSERNFNTSTAIADGIISFTYTLQSASTSTDPYMYLRMRYTDGNNHVQVRFRKSKAVLLDRVNGSYITRDIETSAASTLDQAYDVLVLMDGPHIEVWRGESGSPMSKVLETSEMINDVEGTVTNFIVAQNTYLVVDNIEIAASSNSEDPFGDFSTLQDVTQFEYKWPGESGRVSDLTGLEYANNLDYLHLGGNLIADVTPLGGLTQLTRLYLNDNCLSDSSNLSALSSLSALEELNLGVDWNGSDPTPCGTSQGGISNLSFLEDLTNLWKLVLSRQSITDSQLPHIAGLPNLVWLTLEKNPGVTSISSLSTLDKLEGLYLSECGIASLDASALSNMEALHHLWLDGNPLSSLQPLIDSAQPGAHPELWTAFFTQSLSELSGISEAQASSIWLKVDSRVASRMRHFVQQPAIAAWIAGLGSGTENTFDYVDAYGYDDPDGPYTVVVRTPETCGGSTCATGVVMAPSGTNLADGSFTDYSGNSFRVWFEDYESAQPSVAIAVQPAQDWYLEAWSGDTTSSDNPVVMAVDADLDLSAELVNQYILTLQNYEGGTITSDPPCHAGDPGPCRYDSGTVVTLTATPDNSGWRFEHWECAEDTSIDGSTNSVVSITMDGSKTVAAFFQEQRNLSLSDCTGGSVVVTAGGYTDLSCGDAQDYDLNDTITLTVNADSSTEGVTWRFVGWEGSLAQYLEPRGWLDDFSDGDYADGSPVTWTVSAGAWEAANQYLADISDDPSHIYTPQTSSDYELGFTYQLDSAMGSPLEVYLRRADDDNLVLVEFGPNGLAVKEKANGLFNEQPLALDPEFPTEQGIEYNVLMKAEGRSLEVWRANSVLEPLRKAFQLYTSVEADLLNTNTLDFFVPENQQVQIDDVSVTPLAEVYTLTMTELGDLEAVFLPEHEVSISLDGEGSVAVEQTPGEDALVQVIAEPADGDAAYRVLGDSTLELSGTPEEGWRFASWEMSDNPGILDLANPTTLLVEASKSVIASFVQQYSLYTSVTGNGSVTPAFGDFDAGTPVELVAEADSGWVFKEWTGDLIGNENPATITMDDDKDINALFTDHVTLTTNAVGGGTVSPATGEHRVGEEVALTPTPDTGKAFSHWDAGCSVASGGGASEDLVVRMESDCTVTANFTAAAHLTASIAAGEGVLVADLVRSDGYYPLGTILTVTAEPVSGQLFERWETDGTIQAGDLLSPQITLLLDADTVLTAYFMEGYEVQSSISGGTGVIERDPDASWYAASAQVIFTVTPHTGYVFDHWEVSEGLGLTDGTVNPAVVQVNGTGTVTAFLTPVTHTLTTSVSGSGSVSPASGSYAHATSVDLTATPDAGWYFAEWTGDVAGYDAQTSITMDGDKSVTAVFVQSLSMTATASGFGTVTPSGGTYLPGDVVTLTATPDQGHYFVGWQGDASGSENPLSFPIYRDTNITGHFFSENEFSTAVIGQGTVSPDSGTYLAGTQVVVTATPDDGWVFSHWDDGASGTDNPVTVTIPLSGTVTAVFVPLCTIKVSPIGSGIIDVFDEDTLLTPDADDNYTVGEGRELTLVPEPAIGAAFFHWAGTHELSGNPATFTVVPDSQIFAVFRLNCTIDIEATGNGQVTLSPVQPDEGYAAGTEVTLTAVADTDWAFKRWESSQAQDYRASTTVLTTYPGLITVRAVFDERPGMSSLSLKDDLAQFLVDVGHNAALPDVWTFDFDTGEVEQDGSSVTLLPNDFPDLAELTLLEDILTDTDFGNDLRRTPSHAGIWAKWETNLAQAETALGTTVPDHWKRLTAAYMTLGDWGHREVMPYYLYLQYAIVLDQTGFDVAGERYFDEEGDVDHDGTWNREEWEAVVTDHGDVMDAQTLTDFSAYATDRALDPYPNGFPPLPAASSPPPEELYPIPPAVLALYPLADFDPHQDWSWLAYAPSGMVTLESPDSNSNALDAVMEILEPLGLYDSIPVDTPFRLPMGSKVRVEVSDETSWLSKWSAPDTLLDGSGSPSGTFRLSTYGVLVRAERKTLYPVGIPEYATWNITGPAASLGSSFLTEEGAQYALVPDGCRLQLSPYGNPSTSTTTCGHVGWNVAGIMTYYGIILPLNPSWFPIVDPAFECCDTEPPLAEDYVDGEDDHWYKTDMRYWRSCHENMGAPPPYWEHVVQCGEGCEGFGAQESGKPHYDNVGYLGGLAQDEEPPEDALSWLDYIFFHFELEPGVQTDEMTVEGTTTCKPDEEKEGVTTAPLRVNVTTLAQPALKVYVVSPCSARSVIAGHFEGGVVDNVWDVQGDLEYDLTGLTHFYKALSDCTLDTELIELSAKPHEALGFEFSHWLGNMQVFDVAGNLLGDLSDFDLAQEPTIYVKCGLEGGNKSLNAASSTVTAVMGAAPSWPVLAQDPKALEITFEGGADVVPVLYWSGDSDATSYDWTNDSFLDDGNEIFVPHYLAPTSAGEDGDKPVAFIRNTKPDIKVKIGHGRLYCFLNARLRATLSFAGDTDEVVYEEDITFGALDEETVVNLSGAKASGNVPNKIMNTTTTLEWELSFDGGITYDARLMSGIVFDDAFVLYGKPNADALRDINSFGTFVPRINGFDVGHTPTIARIDYFTHITHGLILRKEIAESIAANTSRTIKISAAPICLWDIVVLTKGECNSARTFAALGCAMLGISSSDLRWTCEQGCTAFPSTDSTAGLGYLSKCTVAEYPSVVPPTANCSGIDHPNGQCCTSYGVYSLRFGGSVAENFFKICSESGTWYYMPGWPYYKSFVGSIVFDDTWDRHGRYGIIDAFRDNNSWYCQAWWDETPQTSVPLCPAAPLP